MNGISIRPTTPVLQLVILNHFPLEVVALLLSSPALDVNGANPPRNGYTALDLALRGNNEELIKLLLTHPQMDASRTSSPCAPFNTYRDGSVILQTVKAGSVRHFLFYTIVWVVDGVFVRSTNHLTGLTRPPLVYNSAIGNVGSTFS